MLDKLREMDYQIKAISHVAAILDGDFTEQLQELEHILTAFRLPIAEIVGGGGGETKGTQRLRRALAERGWIKSRFEITKSINGVQRESISHEIDHVCNTDKGVIALEIEWNNKDPFFDRDLENFKRLHAEGAISLGIIITRSAELQSRLRHLVQQYGEDNGLITSKRLVDASITATPRQICAIAKKTDRGVPFATAWAEVFVNDKYGAATTHWQKLVDRIKRGVGNPCPLLLIGLPVTIVEFPSKESPSQAESVRP
ncbi:MAG: BglII/BstYI family type II restriction endonuclease [Armatimonadota bacterium]